MQITPSSLGNNIHPLGVISPLSNPQRMSLKKESHSLHSRSNFISTIQTKPPLVTSANFFLSRQYEPSIQPLIGWDSWDAEDINSEFALLEFDSYDLIDPLENSTINSNKPEKDSTPAILPTRIEKNPSNNTSQELSIKSKSKSKKTNKPQQPAAKKSKSKPRAKKTIASSGAKKVEQLINENNVIINNEESPSIKANLEAPNLQMDSPSENTINNNNYVTTTTVKTPSLIEDTSTLFRNTLSNNLHPTSEFPSSSPSVELPVTESILPLQDKINLDNNTSELVEAPSIEYPLTNNVEKIFTPSNKFPNNDQTIITEALDSANFLDSLVSPTASQQDIEAHQVSSVVDNKISTTQTNLIQSKENLPTLISPSQEEELTNINNNFEASQVIETDLILKRNPNDFVTDNAVVENYLTLPSALTSPDVNSDPTLLFPLANNENTGELQSNSEPSFVNKPIAVKQEFNPDFSQDMENLTQNATLQPTSLQGDGENLKPLSLHKKGFPDTGKSQEIDLSVTSEFLASAPVELIPTSAYIEDTTSLFSNSDNNEELITSESQSGMAVNISANVTSLQRDEDITSDFTENHSILALPETIEASTISAILPETSEASVVSASSPEIDETPTIIATSSEIGETSVVSASLAEISEAPTITATSPEIFEVPVASASLPEIIEAPTITATSPGIFEASVASAISPKIGEASVASATWPEIVEASVASATSPEIGEAPTITATSPEIVEASVASASLPEISEASVASATSPEIVGEASIFRKIIETVESENPEILTWDNPDILENPTYPQDEVSTAPKVEQNAIAQKPAPKGYATGGHVTDSPVENRQHIAPSDTVPAMLSPGEFVINTRDAQKNLPLLHHINTGGIPHDIILPSLQTPDLTEPEETTSPKTPTKVDSFSDTSLQLKSAETNSPEISNSLIPSSLGLNINQKKLSILNSPQLNPLQNETIDVGEASPQYSSPPLIFRKANSTTKTSSQSSNTPYQWSSVEDLLNVNNDDFTSFNFHDGESNSQNYEFSHGSGSPQVFAKHLPSPRGFANGGEVTLPDISREIQPVTETIESASSSSQGDEKDDTANLEALAREIYHRLRQRIEIERERHGGYSGRLPW
ncbi:hypothetical protein [Nostoc sp. 'Peltigera membranacea cyanobiont' N6]|uniref:hypothetical protein n=1 Tax=Nostoc sp. 'Peltigera membranacea cyanobiont' N6 TaxID=1261031 RepID=UPI000D0C13F8|nr:hypothetical protein [Nostoc sp. 'Peltigera membranacea cyanobiont' N6]AVH62304.1 hypothetical protein NPM_0429 [Nostoc sp. 'Peltigera membranacea cyanobiont' N6]